MNNISDTLLVGALFFLVLGLITDKPGFIVIGFIVAVLYGGFTGIYIFCSLLLKLSQAENKVDIKNNQEN